jgi:hypothetical protein
LQEQSHGIVSEASPHLVFTPVSANAERDAVLANLAYAGKPTTFLYLIASQISWVAVACNAQDDVYIYKRRDVYIHGQVLCHKEKKWAKLLT